MTTNEAIVAHAAQALEDTASSHKRAASYHRRQAREAKEKLAHLIQAALGLGIKVITSKGGGNLRHGPNSKTHIR